MKDEISISDFSKLDIRAGTVIESSKKEGSERLIRLKVDFGNEIRTIFTALYPIYEPEFFLNKQLLFLYNLKSRKMMDEESQGMLLAVDGNPPIPLIPQSKVENGSAVT